MTIDEIDAMADYLGGDEDDEKDWPEVGDHGSPEGPETDLFSRVPARVRAMRELK